MKHANQRYGCSAARAIENEVPAAATPSGNVQRAKAGVNVVPSHAAGDIGSVVQSGDRRNERATISASLAPSEMLDRPIEDGQKVPFGRFR